MNPSLVASVTFIGNATTLLRLGEFTLLTDPNFVPAGSRVHLGYGAFTRRLIGPAGIDSLPAVDAVLLSHLHGDHFDGVARDRLPHDLAIITTPQATARLRRWNFTDVQGLPTWSTNTLHRGEQLLRITAVPGQHGPGLADRLLPDVMGSVLELEVGARSLLRLYVTGDTLMRPLLSEIPKRCGDVDAMIIHLGGTRLLGLLLTMDGRQGAELVNLIRPALTVPVHYDDYSVFTSPLNDFVDRARDLGVTEVHPIARGDTLALPVRS
ncbi:MBL fold metallo-hydrolase [Asanoa sp. NPDC049573]|uniref:MBL fold metallo-hydrolase n=1 Tax=Asanoa sp. NPDC049573 TaxID=3155396 RepID=UPI003432113A